MGPLDLARALRQTAQHLSWTSIFFLSAPLIRTFTGPAMVPQDRDSQGWNPAEELRLGLRMVGTRQTPKETGAVGPGKSSLLK